MTDPVLGHGYARSEIQKLVGGNPMAFLPMVDGLVVGCAFKPHLNTTAPGTLVLGRKWADQGLALAQARNFVPFFRFIDTAKHPQRGKWVYIGDFRVRESTVDPAIVQKEIERGPHDKDCRLVLYMESREEAASREATGEVTALAAIKLAPRAGRAYQPDQAKKVAVENAAMNKTAKHFEGWNVEDVSDKNKGWDLEATKGDTTLYLEVKGLSGSQIVVEVTPNEFERMQQHADRYRVCIVTNALSLDASLRVFEYRKTIGDMFDPVDRKRLAVKKITAARLTAV